MRRRLLRTLDLYLALYRHRGWRRQQAQALRAAGRPLLILGSAPGSRLPDGWRRDDPYIAINASQLAGASLGLGIPALVLMSGGPLFGERQADTNAKAGLRGCRAHTLLFIERGYSLPQAEAALAALDYRYDSAAALLFAECNHIIRQLTGHNWGCGPAEERVSNGLLAIMLGLYLEAPAVVIAGIAPQSVGHAYNAAGQPRMHAAADDAALRLLAGRYPNLYAAAPELAEAYGLKLWRAATA